VPYHAFFCSAMHQHGCSGERFNVFYCRMETCLRLLVVTCLACLIATSIEASQAYFARATSIPDGDTLWVQPDAGGARQKSRLQGVDAPEICEHGGVAARDALRAMVAQRTLKVQVKYLDDYGRGLARIEVDGQDVAALMVQQGQAWSSRWRRSQGPYAAEEFVARYARRGLFAEPDPELPREFRRRHGGCYSADVNGAFRLK
jgi:micrococcal nuclease